MRWERLALLMVVLIGLAACSSDSIASADDCGELAERVADMSMPPEDPQARIEIWERIAERARTLRSKAEDAGDGPMVVACSQVNSEATVEWARLSVEIADEQPQAPTEPLPWTVADFNVELIVLESQCFDTAGALVTVEPDLTIRRAGPTEGQELTVIYEVRGGESIETFRIEVSGNQYSYDEHLISTSSCTYDLNAEVVRLLER